MDAFAVKLSAWSGVLAASSLLYNYFLRTIFGGPAFFTFFWVFAILPFHYAGITLTQAFLPPLWTLLGGLVGYFYAVGWQTNGLVFPNTPNAQENSQSVLRNFLFGAYLAAIIAIARAVATNWAHTSDIVLVIVGGIAWLIVIVAAFFSHQTLDAGLVYAIALHALILGTPAAVLVSLFNDWGAGVQYAIAIGLPLVVLLAVLAAAEKIGNGGTDYAFYNSETVSGFLAFARYFLMTATYALVLVGTVVAWRNGTGVTELLPTSFLAIVIWVALGVGLVSTLIMLVTQQRTPNHRTNTDDGSEPDAVPLMEGDESRMDVAKVRRRRQVAPTDVDLESIDYFAAL